MSWCLVVWSIVSPIVTTAGWPALVRCDGLVLVVVVAVLVSVPIVLKTYAHFLLDDDDRARVIMDLFFETGSSAPDVPEAVR